MTNEYNFDDILPKGWELCIKPINSNPPKTTFISFRCGGLYVDIEYNGAPEDSNFKMALQDLIHLVQGAFNRYEEE